MSPPLQKSQYDLKPICDISALSLSLGMPEQLLINVALQADSLYRKAKPIIKPDGSIRQPFDALQPLKAIQRRIKDRILKRVKFPEYLTGSLSGRDYRTNAAMHAGAKIVICEDIEGFFPSTSHERILDIWLNFFRFSEEVATLLTRLTTKEGSLPQGASTSSYLANLAFWNQEPRLQANLAQMNIVYSRYVDDIAMSSTLALSKTEQTSLIAQVYGMLSRHGYKAKRRKHETFTSGGRMLTTKEGSLPQGASTSSYLANLVFWNQEPRLQANLAQINIVYSRYVDDIAMSSTFTLSKTEQTALIAQVYGMLSRHGYKAKRRKHETFTSGGRMLTTKLVINRKPALSPKDRQNIRAAVHVLEKRVAAGAIGPEIRTELNRVTSRVGRLGAFHPSEASSLKLRLRTIRSAIR